MKKFFLIKYKKKLIVQDEIVQDEIVQDEIVQDEIVQDEIVQDEIVIAAGWASVFFIL